MNIGEFGVFMKGLTATWTPSGEVHEIGEQTNPYESWGDAIAARLFVGLNVKDVPTYDIDEVVGIVKAWREEKGKDPSGSFIAQKGIFKSKISGKTTTENSVQVVIFPENNETIEDLKADMIAMGEHICRRLQQELVILEIQKNGVTHSVGGIKP